MKFSQLFMQLTIEISRIFIALLWRLDTRFTWNKCGKVIFPSRKTAGPFFGFCMIMAPVMKELNKKTLCIVTIAMICSNLASFWKFQYFRRPIYNPVEHLWGSFYFKNSNLLTYSQKSSIVDACLGSKYASAFWRLFKRFISVKYFTS